MEETMTIIKKTPSVSALANIKNRTIRHANRSSTVHQHPTDATEVKAAVDAIMAALNASRAAVISVVNSFFKS